MTYLRAACRVKRFDSVMKEQGYESLGVSQKAEGMNCGVVEWVKRNTVCWYEHDYNKGKVQKDKSHEAYERSTSDCSRQREVSHVLRW